MHFWDGAWNGSMKWTASSEFGAYRLCEQRRFRRACASAQSRQNLRCSLIQAVSQEEPSDRKPDPCPLWMAEHAQLKFVMTECSKTQIRLTGLIYFWCSQRIDVNLFNIFRWRRVHKKIPYHTMYPPPTKNGDVIEYLSNKQLLEANTKYSNQKQVLYMWTVRRRPMFGIHFEAGMVPINRKIETHFSSIKKEMWTI